MKNITSSMKSTIYAVSSTGLSTAVNTAGEAILAAIRGDSAELSPSATAGAIGGAILFTSYRAIRDLLQSLSFAQKITPGQAFAANMVINPLLCIASGIVGNLIQTAGDYDRLDLEEQAAASALGTGVIVVPILTVIGLCCAPRREVTDANRSLLNPGARAEL